MTQKCKVVYYNLLNITNSYVNDQQMCTPVPLRNAPRLSYIQQGLTISGIKSPPSHPAQPHKKPATLQFFLGGYFGGSVVLTVILDGQYHTVESA